MPKRRLGAVNRADPLRKLPRVPAHLGPEAKAEYRRVGKDLISLELLIEMHLPLLIELCEWHQRGIDAEKEVKSRGSDVMDTLPGRKWVDSRQKAFENCLRIKKLFGLTPDTLQRFAANGSDEMAKSRDPLAGLQQMTVK